MAADFRIKDDHIEEYDEYGNCIRSYGYGLGNLIQISVSGNRVAVLNANQCIHIFCDGNYAIQFYVQCPYFIEGIKSIQFSGDGNTILIRHSTGQSYELVHEYSTENGMLLKEVYEYT